MTGDDELVFYSCHVQKYNRYNFQKERIVVVTNAQILFLSKNSFNYKEHRKIPLNRIEAITVCHELTIFEVIIHVKDSYDERMSCVTVENKHNLVGVIEALLTAHGHSYNYYVAEDTKLKKWVT